MFVRSLAAAANGFLVLALYLAVFGVPSATVGLLEATLAQVAAVATWFALKPRGRRSPSLLDSGADGLAAA